MKKEKENATEDNEAEDTKHDNMSPSPAREGSANAGSVNGNLEEKPRLSEHEKKANHIASGTVHSHPLPPLLPDSYYLWRIVTRAVANRLGLSRAEAPASDSRRLRPADGTGAGAGGAGPEREHRVEEDGRLHARAAGGEEELGGKD